MSEIYIERLGDEPIIKAVIKGHFTVEVALEVFQRTTELRKDMPRYIYRITDVSEIETTFTDMMKIIKEASSRAQSTTMDPTIYPVYIGTTHWLKLFTDAMRQGVFGGKEIPIFENWGDALAYVREQIRTAERV